LGGVRSLHAMQSVRSYGLQSGDIHNVHEAVIYRLSDSSLQH